MKNLASGFLSKKDREKIEAAVREVEMKTSGEIVPMVVSSSHHCPMADATGALCLSFPLALFLTRLISDYYWMEHQNMWVFIAAQFVLFWVCRLLTANMIWFKRLFLSRKDVEEEVKEAAIKAFFTKGLYKTRHETGVLIFISVLERKVWVLADRGINEKVAQDQWKKVAGHIISGILGKRQADALCEAIAMTGNVLAGHFPVLPDDTDELTNLIIEN
jgi:putative membrane protein